MAEDTGERIDRTKMSVTENIASIDIMEKVIEGRTNILFRPHSKKKINDC